MEFTIVMVSVKHVLVSEITATCCTSFKSVAAVGLHRFLSGCATCIFCILLSITKETRLVKHHLFLRFYLDATRIINKVHLP